MEQNPNNQAQQQPTQQQTVAQQVLQPIVKATESKEFLMSTIGQQVKKFELTQRMAQVYANSTIVPANYQGNQNLGNVIIAMDMAERMKMNPLQVMQQLNIVYGNPSWSSKALIAMFNQCGRYSSIQYEEKGKPGTDEWGMRAYAYEKSDTKREHPIHGTWVTIGIAKAEGWLNKNGSKWKTMPELMLHYRAASQFINIIAPDISMGFPTTEEVEDMHAVQDAEFEEIQPKMVTFDEPEAAPEKKPEKAAAKPTTDKHSLFN